MTLTALTKNNPVPQSVELMTDTLAGILDWDSLEKILQNIIQATDAEWHIYNNENPLPGDNRPNDVNTSSDLAISMKSLIAYLRQAHPREYCGLVYANSLIEPTLIRIFDPKYLTSMCNIYGNTPAPSWVISTIDPKQLAAGEEVSSKLQNHSLGKKLPDIPNHPQVADTLDARRMGCPLPLVHTARSLRQLSIGEILEVVTIDPGAVNDIEYLCECTGARHLALAEGEYGYSFYIERRKLKHTQNLSHISQELEL